MQRELGRDIIFVLNIEQKDKFEEIYEKEQTFLRTCSFLVVPDTFQMYLEKAIHCTK